MAAERKESLIDLHMGIGPSDYSNRDPTCPVLCVQPDPSVQQRPGLGAG